MNAVISLLAVWFRGFIAVICLAGAGSTVAAQGAIHLPGMPDQAATLGSVEDINPEAATDRGRHKLAQASQYMVSAANPMASQTGVDILARGGSAADAVIAMQMVLNLVEPQSSGIGGGGFAISYHAQSGDVLAWDGRETAPAA